MTSEKETGGQHSDQMLDEVVRNADEYYNWLERRQANEARVDFLVVSLVAWFASFAAIGLSAFALYGRMIYYVLVAFLVAIVIGIGAGLATYTLRNKKTFGFTELGTLLGKAKQGGATSEDGLRLMDAMHAASLATRKKRMTAAFEYGVLAFALVALVGLNAAAGALAGVIVYLYFRYEALQEYEKAEERYEGSKRALLQVL